MINREGDGRYRKSTRVGAGLGSTRPERHATGTRGSLREPRRLFNSPFGLGAEWSRPQKRRVDHSTSSLKRQQLL